jgi:parvulin-like peptidyl-prolyl isomerase
MRGVRNAERAAQPTEARAPEASGRTAAVLDGIAITWDELKPVLAEAAGATSLREVALDRLLAAECDARAVKVSADEVAAERRLLLAAVSQDAGASAGESERLLERVRTSRGLGDVRFAQLLERNARMRKLVAPGVQVSDEEVAQAFEMRHGKKYRARVIVVPTQARAAELKGQIEGAADRLSAFAAAAARYSMDPSAARGGVSEPISPVDPAYPAAARYALKAMNVGDLSQVIAVDRGFALLLVEEVIPDDGASLADKAEGIRAEVRVRRERLAMDELARRLLGSANLVPMDRSLGWSLRSSASP